MRPALSALLFAGVLAGASASPAAAQVDLQWFQGVLGRGVAYRITAPPGSGFGLVVSLNDGPTPLALIDPLDPRKLEVGFDLLGLFQLGVVPPAGQLDVYFQVPAAPAISGVPFHAQAFTWPGATTVVDDLSDAVKFTWSLPGDSVLAMNTLGVARAHASATATPDGNAVVAGGLGSTGPGPAQPLASWELYSAATQEFLPGGSIGAPRARHSDTRLTQARVLLAGGVGPAGTLASSGVLDSAAKSWTSAPPMGKPRVHHTATRLADGRVLVVGGSTQFTAGHPIGWPASLLGPLNKSSELFDPTTNTWSRGPDLPTGLTAHGASLLSSGRVLIAGGVEALQGGGRSVTDKCWLYDPALNSFSRTADMAGARAFHGQSPTVAGGALVVGGSKINFGQAQLSALKSCERTGPLGLTWTAVPDAPGIVTCQRTHCVPGPSYPWPWPFPSDPGYIVYFIDSGVSGIDLTTGTVTPIDDLWEGNAGLTAWKVSGSHAVLRMATAGCVLADGLRLLTVGPTTQAGTDPKTGELYTTQ